MSETKDRYRSVAAGFADRLDHVTAEGWALPTPCSDWDVRALVTHVVDTHGRVLESLGESPPSQDGDLLARFAEARGEVEEALADPARASATVSGMFGEQPFESLVGRLLCADTLIHTWDLARATGQDERLNPSAVAATSVFLAPIDEAVRRPGGFAPKIAPAEGADEQTRLLNFCGRAV